MGAVGFNALYRVAAGLGGLLGVFLLMGAYGHVEATAASPERSVPALSADWFALMLPALVLAAAGVTNVGVCMALWRGADWALQLALLATLSAVFYLIYLMTTDLPEHPVGLFLALVVCHLVLLAGIRAGLVWPARSE
ncbi:MAG: hypothetical protein AAF184_18190 [Pseudomonadota bacterium]